MFSKYFEILIHYFLQNLSHYVYSVFSHSSISYFPPKPKSTWLWFDSFSVAFLDDPGMLLQSNYPNSFMCKGFLVIYLKFHSSTFFKCLKYIWTHFSKKNRGKRQSWEVLFFLPRWPCCLALFNPIKMTIKSLELY
jgi:hypothetical protein